MPEFLYGIVPKLLFEAAVLQDGEDKAIPDHNFTLVNPYVAKYCDPLLTDPNKALKPKLLSFLEANDVWIKKTFDPDWFSRTKRDFQELRPSGCSPELLRRCFDHVVGLVTMPYRNSGIDLAN